MKQKMMRKKMFGMCRYGILYGHQDRVTVLVYNWIQPYGGLISARMYTTHCTLQNSKMVFCVLRPRRLSHVTFTVFDILCMWVGVWIESDRIGILYVNTSNQPKYAKCLERQITCKWCKSAIARHHYLIYSVSMVGLVRFVTCFLFFVCCCTHLHITLGFLAENPLVFNKKQRTRIKQRRK